MLYIQPMCGEPSPKSRRNPPASFVTTTHCVLATIDHNAGKKYFFSKKANISDFKRIYANICERSVFKMRIAPGRAGTPCAPIPGLFRSCLLHFLASLSKNCSHPDLSEQSRNHGPDLCELSWTFAHFRETSRTFPQQSVTLCTWSEPNSSHLSYSTHCRCSLSIA